MPICRLGVVTSKLLEIYGWDRVALLYFKNELDYCSSVVNDVEKSLYNESKSVQIVMKAEIDGSNSESTSATLQVVKTRARGKWV